MTTERDAFVEKSGVSRETIERLDQYAELLGRWTKRINLVSPSTLPLVWSRHFLDSAQLLRLGPERGQWADLGSGGGFPGAVLAILAKELKPELTFTLVESDARKSTFLRTVSRETDVKFDVVTARIEELEPLAADVVSARALASLSDLIGMAKRHLKSGGVAIFPKGAKADEELVSAVESWRFDCETYSSDTDAEAVILKIGDIERV